MEILSGVIAYVDNFKRHGQSVKDLRGYILIFTGPPGTGKTKLCEAIADAFLKHPEVASIFCHSESITGESELGTQLFKTIFKKDIGKRRPSDMFGNTMGLIPKDE